MNNKKEKKTEKTMKKGRGVYGLLRAALDDDASLRVRGHSCLKYCFGLIVRKYRKEEKEKYLCTKIEERT